MYRIGKFVFEIEQINDNRTLSGLNFFHCSDKLYECDAKYQIIYQNSLPEFNIKDITYKNNFLYAKNDGDKYYYYHLLQNRVYAIVEENRNNYCIYLLNYDYHPYIIPNLLRMEKHLLNLDSFIFHSSYISYHDQAILFTAPSGGGKSTQADLWMKYKGAKILNGDRSIVGKENKEWFVYGVPISGSSPYCANRTTPLNAIIILEKGPVNQLTRVDIRGFNRIFSQVTVNLWDKDFCNKIMDLVMNLCNEVPIYIYSCTKDESAVDYLYDRLVKDGVINGCR